MKLKKFNVSDGRRRVLIAPLDWGLGHATRCIPIIYSFKEHNFEVIIAADGAIKNLLQTEFPDVVFTVLNGYKIRYSYSGYWLPLKLLLQFPRLLWSTYSEHRWLKKTIRRYKIDIVISDNRLGLHDKAVPCIYITHQLKIITGNHFTEWLAQKMHYFFINKYTACWVPDNEHDNILAGDLSHPKKMPAIPVKYTGPLSRFEKNVSEKKYDLLVLVSGPEPQRTIFESLMTKELKTFQGKALLVRGLPEYKEIDAAAVTGENNITTVNHLTAKALNDAVLQSEWVICRSGYTTIMDLIKLDHKAILIPTPGQTEQEYLAAFLNSKKIFFTALQQDFALGNVLKNAAVFSSEKCNWQMGGYKKIISDLIVSLAL
jgi:uncharacterized protein (TIGR00661 family)